MNIVLILLLAIGICSIILIIITEQQKFIKFRSMILENSSNFYHKKYEYHKSKATKLVGEIEQYISNEDDNIYQVMKKELDDSITSLEIINSQMKTYLEQYKFLIGKHKWKCIFSDKYKEDFKSISLMED